MIGKKDLIVAVLLTFCFTATLFIITPSRSQSAKHEYDPWLDLNDDGKINIQDFAILAQYYPTSGTPVNKTDLLLNLQSRLQDLEAEVETLEANGTVLADTYERVRGSVVFISGNITDQTTIQGSGFVYNFSSKMVVVTNFHVVRGTTIRSVTFSDGNGYAATILGTDAYSDLAVLSVSAPAYEFKPLEIVSSSALRVGVPVIAVGNPFGLVGSMTTGVVSALGRAITEDIMGGFQIGNVIQTSAPINPGNSGGPLLTYGGKVVGITAAIVADSQGLGFAIPSSALLKEIASLIQNGTYDAHSYLGVSGSDMNYDKALGTPLNVTYGWQISQVKSGGPSDGKLAPNDVIIAMNGTRVRNGDDLASYLEGNTLPGETANVKVVRLNQTLEVSVVLGKRPPPPV